MTTDRAAAIVAFLRRHGWDGADRRPLAGDASFRRYERLTRDGARMVLMDAPPPQEDVTPFVTVAGHLADLGFSAPRIAASDEAAGLLLLEDLGDDTFTGALAAGGDEQALYRLAVDLLVALHRRADAAAIDLPPYDEAPLLAEAGLLVDWYLPVVTGVPTADPLRADYLEAWRQVLPHAAGLPPTLVLRDYHVDNLMVLADRAGVAACGLLDFQDALIGSPAYDLVSLLEDARRDVPPAIVAEMYDRYLTARGDLDRARFAAAYDVLGAQRNAKIIGIFTRLCRRDGKPHYLGHIPRVWRLLHRDLTNPALAPVADWLDAHLPPDLRTAPPTAAS